MYLPAIVTEDTRPTKPCQRFEGHTGWVQGVIHLPGGQQIMTCSYDGSLGVWNLQTGKHIANWQDGESGVSSIALSVDGKKLVSGSDSGSVRLWNMETGEVLAKWTGHTQPVWSVCWNGDNDRALSGSLDGTARVWDVETGNTILEIDTARLDHVCTATFSPDSTLIATSGDSSVRERMKIWDANTGKLVSILKGHTDTVFCLAWTADGRTLISGSFDSTIRTWNTSTWQELAVLTGHTGSIFGIAISPNGRTLASASSDDTARLWNLENGQPIGSPLQHPKGVTCVSFSTDGTLLATGCHDKNAYTWDISVIIKEAGLNELLDGEKSFLHADATRRPVQQPKNVPTVPTNFFADPSPHPDPAIIRPISSPTQSTHDDAPPEEVEPSSPERARHGFFAWLHSITPARLRDRFHFFRRTQRHRDEGVELQERPPSILNVPLAQGLLRHANEAGVRRMREKKNTDEDADEAEDENETDEKERAKQATVANNSKNAMNVVPTSPPPPTRSNVAQPSTGPSRPKRSAEPHATTFTSPADAATSIPNTSTTLPGAVALRVGCCTYFFLCTGSVSRYRDGHH